MPRLFKDLAKAVNDALNKGFDTATSVKVTTSTSSDSSKVKYTADVKAKGDAVNGKLTASFKTDSGLNFKKFEISNTGALSSLVHLTDAVDNTTFTLDCNLQPLRLSGKGEKCEVGVDYAHEKARISVVVSPVLPSSAAVTALVKACDGCVVGGAYSGKLDDTWVHTRADAGLAYHSAGSVVSLSTSDFLQKFTLGAHLQHCKTLAFAARVGLNRANAGSADITLGAVHNIDNDTTLKTKLSVPTGSVADSSVSVGFSKRLSKDVKVNVGSAISVGTTDGAHSASVGLGLELGSA